MSGPMSRKKKSAESPKAAPMNRFPMSFKVEQGGVMTVAGSSSSSYSYRRTLRVEKVEDEKKFVQVGKDTERRAMDLMRKGLVWVEKMSEGQVDREVLKESAKHLHVSLYKDLLLERHTNSICSYPACSNPPRRPYQTFTTYKVRLERGKIVEDKDSGFCSKKCRARSRWFEEVVLTGFMEFEDVKLMEELEEEQEAEDSAENASSTLKTPTSPNFPSPKTSSPVTTNSEINSIISGLSILEITPSPTAVASPPTLNDEDEGTSLPSPSRFKRKSPVPPISSGPSKLLLSSSTITKSEYYHEYKEMGVPFDTEEDDPAVLEAWAVMGAAKELK